MAFTPQQLVMLEQVREGREAPPAAKRQAVPQPLPQAVQAAVQPLAQAAGVDTPLRPEQPKTFQESGISYRVLEGLILKTIKQLGPQSEEQLSEALKLNSNVFHDVVASLEKRELLLTPVPLVYDLSNLGRELTALVERDDSYVGPAPVSHAAYCAMCRGQAETEQWVTMAEVEEVFAEEEMTDDIKRELRDGFNSQRAMLFYGPPGNGKSLTTKRLHELLKTPVVLPYAFEFNGKVVQLYDPAFHEMLEPLMQQEEDRVADSLATTGKPDRRWVISRPPYVTVSTEFKVAHMEIAFDGQYFAPPHVKANNGVFIFDDLGRQTEDHNMILNQFIFPLEEHEAIIKFPGGSSMRVPYRQRLFLSTNLNHEEIIDDAFRRRILYQILVDRPTASQWKAIFQRQAQGHGLREELAMELAEALMNWYEQDERLIRRSDPRDLLVKALASLDKGQDANATLNVAWMRRIYERFPTAYKRDAKFYVGAMDSVGHEKAER